MPVTKKQLVEQIVSEVWIDLQKRIKVLIREEFDLERKRLRSILMEDFALLKAVKTTATKPVQKVSQKPIVPDDFQMEPLIKLPNRTKKYSIDTGDPFISQLLEDVQIDERLLPEEETKLRKKPNFSAFNFEPPEEFQQVSQSFKEATQHAVTEQRQLNRMWRPDPGEAYNFDPTRMDPTKIDWSAFVDATDEKSKERKHHLPG